MLPICTLKSGIEVGYGIKTGNAYGNFPEI